MKKEATNFGGERQDERREEDSEITLNGVIAPPTRHLLKERLIVPGHLHGVHYMSEQEFGNRHTECPEITGWKRSIE
jgi:hypothetical protein